MSDLAHCLAILKALEVSEVKYCLSGGGDSGTAVESLFDDIERGRRLAPRD